MVTEQYRIEHPTYVDVIYHIEGRRVATLSRHSFKTRRTIVKTIRWSKQWVEEQLRIAAEEQAQGLLF